MLSAGLRKFHSVKLVNSFPLARVMIARDFVSTFPKTRAEFDLWRKEFQGLEIDKQSDDPLASWKPGHLIQLPKLPVHPSPSTFSFELFLTRQRLAILSKFFKNNMDFVSLSGPLGVGKSGIGYTAACIAFVNQMPLFYLPNPQHQHWQLGGVKKFLNHFVSLNQFVEDKEIQSAISKIQQQLSHDGDEHRLAELAALALCDSKALRIVDEIDFAYTGEGKMLDPLIPHYLRSIIDEKGNHGTGSYGQLLAIGSPNSKYEASLHERWWRFRVAVVPPPKDEFLEIVRPLATEKLSKGPQVAEGDVPSVDQMVSEAIDELGSPRHVTNFLNELPPNPDVSSFFASLRKYSDNLAGLMESPISAVLDSLPDQDKNKMIDTLRQLAATTRAPKVFAASGKLRDCGLAYEDESNLQLLGRAAKKAFFLSLCKKGFLPTTLPVWNPNPFYLTPLEERAGLQREEIMQRHLKDFITFNGFVTEPQLTILRTFELFSLDQNMSAVSQLTTIVLPRQQSFCGLDFLITDPERKAIYAVQISVHPFFVDQWRKFESGSSLLQVLTGTCSPRTKKTADKKASSVEKGKNRNAKKVICKILGLSEDSTKFTLNKTAGRIDIKEGKKNRSPWHIIPVFMTESPRSENQAKRFSDIVTMVIRLDFDVTSDGKRKIARLQRFHPRVQLLASEDLKEFYGWNGDATRLYQEKFL